MQFDYLREFQLVASMLNFTKAAKVLHISQSSLSKHIIELENNTGLMLFDHESAKPKLTPIGNEFLKEISLIVSSYDAALSKCLAMQAAGLRTLTFQEASLSAGMRVLYHGIQKYSTSHPNTDICFSDMRNCSSIIDALERNVVDIALDMQCDSANQKNYVQEMDDIGYRIMPIYQGPSVIWFRTDNQLIECDRVILENIVNTPIMTSSGKNFDSVRPAINALFLREGVAPHFKMVHMATRSSLSAYFLSDYGNSVLITTELMINDDRFNTREDIVYKISEDPKLYMTIYLVTSKQNTLANEFFDFTEPIISTCYSD